MGSRGRITAWISRTTFDFRDYFSSLDHQWLERFLEHRIADKRVLRLIQKMAGRGGHREQIVDGCSRKAFRKGLQLHRFWRTSTCTTSSTSGLASGELGTRTATS